MGFTTLPPEYVGVFNKVSYVYEAVNNSWTYVNSTGNLVIKGAFGAVNVGDFIMLGGPDLDYRGTFKILNKVAAGYIPGPGGLIAVYNVTLDLPNVGFSSGGIWVKAGKLQFNIQINGVTQDALFVSPQPVTLKYIFRVDGFLKKYAILTAPVPGPDSNISFSFRVLPAITGIVVISPTRYAYYGFENPTLAAIQDGAPLGLPPIAFQDKQGKALPVIFSKIDEDTKKVHNYLTINPDQVITSPAVSFELLAGGVYTITFQHTGPIADLNFDPALPAWITVMSSPANQVILRIQTFEGLGGDYSGTDYSAEDYLTSTINDLVGCYAFDIKDGDTTIFEFEFCIGPVLGIQQLCPSDALNFCFLNASGGYTTVIVPCRYTKGVEFGKEVVAVRSNGQKIRAEYSDVFRNYEVNAQVLSKRMLDYIEAMRLSIHVLLYNDKTKAYDIPVVIDKSNFRTYGNRFNATEASAQFSFDVAQEVNVQTQ